MNNVICYLKSTTFSNPKKQKYGGIFKYHHASCKFSSKGEIFCCTTMPLFSVIGINWSLIFFFLLVNYIYDQLYSLHLKETHIA